MKRNLLAFLTMMMLAGMPAFAQTVTGVVTSMEDGSPLPGVSVVVKGTTTGTSTDVNGRYSLTVPSGQEEVLIFSFVGFLSEEISVSGRSVLDVTLAPDVQLLSEIVVTALGIERDQKSLGYSVSRISSEEITATGNTNFASALYGRAPGVRISTAPGGATSGVNVQIRGINSIYFNRQPLYVVDGIVMRDVNAGSGGLNNDGYWDDQRIRGNGILDINPGDIESLTVLKGASASALYGSEAASGVVVITTKKGTKAKGLGVDVGYTYTTEEVAVLPDYQNTYGPGYDRATNLAVGANEEGWITGDFNGDGQQDRRVNFRAYQQFGPKFTGESLPWWDGEMRPYSAQPDNYKDFYRKGYNSLFNLSLSNNTEKIAYRISYSRNDYEGIQRGTEYERNTFGLNSTVKFHDKLTADVVVNYMNSYVLNRPYQINRITANYGGFFGRSDDMSLYLNKYQTSAGFKWVPFDQTARNPEEALRFNIRGGDVLDFLWTQLRNSEEEFQDRIISSVTLNYDILPGFNIRGRVGNDLTNRRIEDKRYNEYPTVFNVGGNSTGMYSVSKGIYSIFYSDVLARYSKNIGQDFVFTLNGGFQFREEEYDDQTLRTEGGLDDVNWFSLSNSVMQLVGNRTRSQLMRYAYLGIINLSYKDYLFLEGTARQEYSSTLPPGSNSFFYPSVNTGFVFSEAFALPAFFNFGKLRASYGVVGTSPEIYVANILYAKQSIQTINGSVPYLSANHSYGNNTIRPENKHEIELGLETRMLNNKVGFDVTYFTSRIIDQILSLDLPTSTGASTILANVGELRSKGLEIGLNFTPLSRAVRWDARVNFATVNTSVHKLTEGVPQLNLFGPADGGALLVVAEEGQLLGNIYTRPRATDENGRFIINENGLYTLSDEMTKSGNILPKATGGVANTFTYKGFALDVLIDYRFGGQIVSTPLHYATGAGMYESTMKYRDEANGGLPYYVDNGEFILLPSHNSAAPNGSEVYHDGVLLDGVTADGEENTRVIQAATYYFNTYAWSSGWYEDGAVYDNSFIKLRELSLGYNLPKSFTDKIKFQNVRVSLVGRNLLYLWKTLPHLDPEVAIGTDYVRQGIDEGSTAANRSYGFSLNFSF